MILADKIIINRKKLNLTQEALAEKINVSRQAVSKWESGHSIPEMDKVILLSDLFKVSIDYLLRDDIDDIEISNNEAEVKERKISIEEANTFLKLNEKSSKYVSFGVMLCIISPMALIFITSAANYNLIRLTESSASSIGLVILLSLVSIAVGLFITSSSFMSDYNFFETENFKLEYGAEEMIVQKQENRSKKNNRNIILGTVLIILSVIPVIISDSFTSSIYTEVYSVPLLLFTVSFAVYILVRNAIKNGEYDKLLQKNDYSLSKKENYKIYGAIASVYWLLIVTAFLAYSFIFNAWSKSWIIWPIAGVLFALIMTIFYLFIKKK